MTTAARKSTIAAGTVAILVALAALRAVDLWWWRAQLLRTADARAANAAFILSEYVREAFAAGDASLRQIALHSTRIGGPHAPASEWTSTLASARAGLRGVGSISVVDAAGIIRFSTQPAIVGQSRADNYVFRRLRDDPAGDALVVDRPFLSVAEPRQYLVPIGRRLVSADGAFDGIVVATFTPSAQPSLFRTVDVGARGVVSVFHPDGAVLFREPSRSAAINQPAIGDPIFEAARHASGPDVVHGAIAPGGPIYLTAYRVMPAPPLIVAVSLERSEVLADWREQTVLSILASVVLAALMAATLGLLFKQMDAKALAEAALERARRAEAERLREANERLSAALESEQSARRAAEEANRLKDEFLMTVSHELRTPLNSIYGWARMLLTGQLDDQRRQTALETIERNARAQTHLIDDLLDVSSAMGGRLRLDVRSVHVPDVIRHVLDTSRPAAEAKSIRLESTADPDLPPACADPQRLQQIVWNLVANAIKFTPVGGRVHVHAARRETPLPSVEIAVSDTGPGIPPEFLPHVFEPFRQAEGGTKRSFGGLGLGLAIVRHLVELHGGTVTVDGGTGGGATFRVQLPTRSPVGSSTGSSSRLSVESRYEPSTGL